MTESIKVKDFMNERPIHVVCGTPLGKVIDLLLDQGVTGVPVINEQHEVIGFVSEQDCISHMLKSSYYCDLEPMVNEVMREEVFTLSPEQHMVDVAGMMQVGKPRVYPVVQDKKLLGLISRNDVLQALKENQALCQKHH